jgi:hypothetical protein
VGGPHQACFFVLAPTSLFRGGADIGSQHYYYSDIAMSRPVSLCFFYLVAFIN